VDLGEEDDADDQDDGLVDVDESDDVRFMLNTSLPDTYNRFRTLKLY
jgi:hypothetical protein